MAPSRFQEVKISPLEERRTIALLNSNLVMFWETKASGIASDMDHQQLPLK
jgi:hypothetical protein